MPPSSSAQQDTRPSATSDNLPEQGQVVQSPGKQPMDQSNSRVEAAKPTQPPNSTPRSPATTTTAAPNPPSLLSQNLNRFLDAQNARLPRSHLTVLERAYLELRRGRKTSHWIWFVFPQLAGIVPNPSPRTSYFALKSAAEARAYLAHPELGPRLRAMMRVVLETRAESIEELMGGEVDAEKLRSCVTLFVEAAPEEEVFGKVLEECFDGDRDENTLDALANLDGGI